MKRLQNILKKITSISIVNTLLIALLVVIPIPKAVSLTNVSCQTAGSPNLTEQNTIQVSPVHGSIFYIDTGQNQTVDAAYVGYKIKPSSAQTNLWASLDTFSGGVVSLANPSDKYYPIGNLAANGTNTAYFLLKASKSTTTAQTHTLHVYQGRPDLAGSTEKYACNFTFIKVAETIKAAANKVSSIVPSTTTLYTGTDLTVTVRGFSGTIGKGSPLDGTMMWFSPASSSAWPTGSLRLNSVTIRLYNKKNLNNGSLVTGGTFTDQLYIKNLTTGPAIASGSSYYYQASYIFTVLGASPTAPSVAPIAQIASGTQIKHTDIASLPAVTLATNTITVNAQVTKTASTSITISSNYIRVAYTISLINYATSAITFDQVLDAASSNLTYLAGSVRVGGSTYPDPIMDSSGRWVFGQPITVGAASAGSSTTVSVTYTMQSVSTCTGSTPYSFLNTVSANIGSSVIAESTTTVSGVTTSGTCSSTTATVTTTSTALSPEVNTTAATGLGITGSTANATLNGTVNPHGDNGSATVFEYSTDPALVGSTTIQPSTHTSTAGETSVYAISKSLTGLTANQTYYYRAVVGSGSTAVYGDIFSFTTPIVPTAPTATTNAATNVSTTGADLNGSVNANATSTTVKFEYKNVSTTDGSCPAGELSSGTTFTGYLQGDAGNLTLTSTSATDVTLTITGLSANVFYCYRTVAYYSSTSTTGGWVSFKAATPTTQTITFTVVPTSVNTNSSSSVTASTNAAGLSVTYTSNTPSVCTVNATSGAITTYSVAGTCSITASQPGTATVYPATPVTVTFPVVGPVTLSYNLNGATGGSTPTSQSVVIGGSVIVNNPSGSITRTNFTFAGWNTNSAGTGTTYSGGDSITLNADLILYAKWTSTITYDGNNKTSGTVPSSYTGVSSTVALQTNSGTLARTNYSFNGWNTNSGGTGTHYNVSSLYNLNGNVTMFAEWVPDTLWRITYFGQGNDGGSVPAPADVTKGSNYTIATGTQTKTNFSFGGWNTLSDYSGTTYAANGTISNVSANISLYAIWQGNVTYNGNNNTSGSTPSTQSNIKEGASFTTAANSGGTALARTGYTFVGWNTLANGTGTTYLDNTSYKFNGTMTLYAKWQPDALTVTFNDNGINGNPNSTATQTVYYNVTTTLDPNSFTATNGSVFAGWATTSANATSKTSLIGDMAQVTLTAAQTYYAAWNTSYTVTYSATNANTTATTSGTAPSDINSPYGSGSTVTVLDNSDLALTNYTFAGWCTTSSSSNSLTTCSTGTRYNAGQTFTISANTTLYPIWTLNTYTLTYTAGANGTLSGTSPQTVGYGNNGSAVTATGSTGYHFVNWSDSSTQNPRTDTNVTANVTVTANFAINTYTLTYTAGANGSISGTSPQTVNHGSNGTAVTANAATGYHFVNWSDSSTQNPRTETNVTSNLTVTANFAINTYTLTYTAGANGSISGTSPQTVNHGSNGTAVSANAATGYHFVNWSDSSTQNPRTETNVTSNLTVTANFAVTKYTITYNANTGKYADNGNTKTANLDYNSDAVLQAPENPTLTGHSLLGWSTSSTATTALATYLVPASNQTLYAVWSENSYVISFNAIRNGGSFGTSPTDTQTVSVKFQADALSFAPSNPSKAGETFIGWNDDPSSSSALTHFIVGAAPATLYAIYAAGPVVFTVTFDGNSQTSGSPSPLTATQATSGATITLASGSGLTKNNYTFGGWSLTGSGTPLAGSTYTPTSNITLYAIWTPVKYNITYVANSGGSLTSGGSAKTSPYVQSIDYLGDAASVTAVASTGYVFANWDDNPATTATRTDLGITGAVTYTASFTHLSYTITYAAGTGGTLTGTASQNIFYGNSGSQVTAVPNTGYRFVKWSDNGNSASRTESNVTSSASYNAIFEIITFTLTYNQGDHGTLSGVSPQTVDYDGSGSAVSVTAATGYTFANWSADGSTANPRTDTHVTSNKSFTATYTVNSYTITFDTNGGKYSDNSTAKNVSLNYNVDALLNVPSTPTYTGHTLLGWHTNSGSTSALTQFLVPASAQTLFAIWTTDPVYTITFDTNTGDGGSTASQTGNGSVNLRANGFTKSGYTFQGWATTSTGSKAYDDQGSYTLSADATLFALWTVISPGGGGGSTPVVTPRVPVVTAIAAKEVCATGVSLLIQGSNLSGASVTLDGVAVRIASSSDTALLLELPAGGIGTKTLKVFNADGSAATSIKYVLLNDPVYYNFTYPETYKGSEFTYTFAATNAYGYAVEGTLPNGLFLNAATGEIYGTPTVEGDFKFALVALNPCGNSYLDVYMFVDKPIPPNYTCSVAFNIPTSNTITPAKIDALKNCLTRILTQGPTTIDPVIFLSGGVPLGSSIEQMIANPRYTQIVGIIDSLNIVAQIYVGAFTGPTDQVQVMVYWPVPLNV